MPTTSDGKDQHDDRVIVLKWSKRSFVPNVPGRDLYETDVQALVVREKQDHALIPVETDDKGQPVEKPITVRSVTAALVSSGAYEVVEKPQPKPEKTEAKPDVPAPKEK